MTGISYESGKLEALKLAVGSWSELNFSSTLPDKNPKIWQMLRCSAGIAEELGELVEQLDPSTVHTVDLAEARDAIADMCIFAMDLLYNAHFKMQDVLLKDTTPSKWEVEYLRERAEVDPLLMGLTYMVGSLNHHVLKECQQIRNKENHFEGIAQCMCHIWRLCSRLCHHLKADINVLVEEVATKVLKRDWAKEPDDAHHVWNEDTNPDVFIDPRTAANLKGGVND